MRFDHIIQLVGLCLDKTKSVKYHIHACRLALHSELFKSVYGPEFNSERAYSSYNIQLQNPEILADFLQWIDSNEHLPLLVDDATLPARCFELWKLGVKLEV